MGEPSTQMSLMLRLKKPGDQLAWHEFVSIYEPLILRLMHQRGLQEADARDVTQQVIIAVTQAVDQWEPDGQDASFRRWLFTIARNLSLKFIQRGRIPHDKTRRGVGGTDMLEILDQFEEPEHRTAVEFDDAYRNEVFRWAAEQVKREFRDNTWQAFWRTCVMNESVSEVATRLRMSAGNVYVARSRVLGRLRRTVEEFEAHHAHQ
jgi:RNA polymerase sigma factor (sigma-70 family)